MQDNERRIQEIRARCEAQKAEMVGKTLELSDEYLIREMVEEDEYRPAFAALAIHSRKDIPWLLDRIAELEAERAEAQRREQAAVHDLKLLMKASEHSCLVCADGDCENSPDCEPEWRGPLPAAPEQKGV